MESIEASIWIAAPRDRVWQALTDPDQLGQWLLPPALGAQLTRDDDGRLLVNMGPMQAPIAILESVEPPSQVTSRGLPERQLAVRFTLDQDRNGTRVTVRMLGLDALAKDAARERLDVSRSAWDKALTNLKAYVEGKPLPFPEGYVAALFGYKREGKEKISVERSIWIAAPRRRVWRAITDPAEIEQWFSPGTKWRATALQPGGELSVFDPEKNDFGHVNIIDVVEPPYKFVCHEAPGTSESPHTSTWTLTEENGSTRVTLTYSGFELESVDTRHNNMEQNAFGFGMLFENLKAEIEGSSLPYPMGF